jgi:drug/metabolite transporter (DMT)-like permease
MLLLSFSWGLNWVASATALKEIPPWSLRFSALTIGTATLIAAAFLGGRNLRITPAQAVHVFVAGMFNVAAFNMFSVFAQLGTDTSRVVIICYSMPIWTAVLGFLLLGEQFNRIKVLALMLCIAGLTILVYPLVKHGVPVALLYALGCALGWALATIYIKWVDVRIDPLTNAAWQLVFGWFVITAGMLVFDGTPQLGAAHATAFGAVLFMGVFGTGLAHFLWWAIVHRLPATTAALGSLLVPVVGVSASAAILGERPTITDIAGFAMIFAAAACVLLQRGVSREALPE